MTFLLFVLSFLY
ncbi:hypothetical protein BpHYR1_023667 [Brachionus plicatilis]|uniref:Uncharacterized protein n=1 Tax=Brachionus plicatilis TaxID=10195 RepID=A0A3M7RBG4_BRAPC|nr:hypothetical protein BpHYR1_023667 [Brachionus plicatilis]